MLHLRTVIFFERRGKQPRSSSFRSRVFLYTFFFGCFPHLCKLIVGVHKCFVLRLNQLVARADISPHLTGLLQEILSRICSCLDRRSYLWNPGSSERWITFCNDIECHLLSFFSCLIGDHRIISCLDIYFEWPMGWWMHQHFDLTTLRIVSAESLFFMESLSKNIFIGQGWVVF